jgi:hypothetical protein
MNLKAQSTVEIISHVKLLVQKEKSLTVQIIDTLLEIDQRKAFLPKQTNMYSFLIEELGYCSGTAMLRLNAVRALKVVPEVREKILDNRLSLNDVAKTQSYINKVNRSTSEPLSTAEQKELFEVAEKATAKDLELALVKKHNEIEKHRAEAAGGTAPEPRKVYRKIVVEAEPEVIELIEELKSLLSHKIIDGNLNEILKEALPLAIREIKIKKGLVKRRSALKPSTETSSMMAQEVKSPERAKKVTRSIPNRIKRLVWERDQGRCQFRDPLTNKICGSTFQVEFDHLRPWSFNGEHSVENITTSCKSHNLFRWQGVVCMNFDSKAE